MSTVTIHYGLKQTELTIMPNASAKSSAFSFAPQFKIQGETDFDRYRHKLHKSDPPFSNFLVLDPGETTGIAVFAECNLVAYGQIRTEPADLYNLVVLFHLPVVCENYRVYPSKIHEHAGSPVYTLRRIGEIEAASANYNLRLEFQMAAHAKGLMTDDKMEHLGMLIRGKRHAMDAARHGAYFMIR